MSHQEDELGEMDVDMDKERYIVVEMVNGTSHSLVYRYLDLDRLARDEELLVEVEDVPEVEVEDEDEGDWVVQMEEELEVEVDEDEGLVADMEELELDEQDIIPLTQTWSWGPGISVEALMEEDADARFSEGARYGFSVQELMQEIMQEIMDDNDAVERFK